MFRQAITKNKAFVVLPDGRLVSGSEDGVVKLWNVGTESATATTTYKNPQLSSAVRFLAVSENTCLVIGYQSGAIELIKVSSKVPYDSCMLSNTPVGLTGLVALSGGYVVSGYEDGLIRIWNLNLKNTGHIAPLAPMTIHPRAVTSFTVLAGKDDYLMTGSTAGEISLWQLSGMGLIKGLELIFTSTVKSQSHSLTACAFLENWQIVSCNAAGEMHLWKMNLEKKEKTISLVTQFDTGADHSTMTLVPWHAADKFISVDLNGTIQLWHSAPKYRASAVSSPGRNDSIIEKRDSFIAELSNIFQRKSNSVAFIMENRFTLEGAVALDEEKLPESFPIVKISEKGKQLGRGAFGFVYEAKLMSENVSVAVKEVSSLGAELLNEMQLHIQLSHPNILSLYGAFYEELEYSLVTELMSGGDLSHKLHNTDVELSNNEIIGLLLDIVAGLVYLHSLNIIYRDLKPANILLNAQGRAKLADFGISCQWDGQSPGIEEFAGTLQYMAPELFAFKLDKSKKSYSNKATDIFSLAILLEEMVTRKVPYQIQLAGLSPVRQNELRRLSSRFDRQMAPRSKLSNEVESVAIEKPGRVRGMIAQWEKNQNSSAQAPLASHSASTPVENPLRDQVRDFENEWHENQEKMNVNELTLSSIEPALEAAAEDMSLLDKLSKQRDAALRERDQLNKRQHYIHSERLICLILLGERPTIPAETHEGLRGIITQCGMYQAKDRPTIMAVEGQLQVLQRDALAKF